MINADFKPNPLKDKTLNFAIRIVKLYQFLSNQKKEFVIAKQILRCGTNPGAMVREANNAECWNGFHSQISNCSKRIR
jgi:four helix bundle protein